jgi:hypothetical protein
LTSLVFSVNDVKRRRQQRQQCQFCPLSMPSILSTPSMPSRIAPPPGGVAKSAHEGMFALVPSGDFGEITDTVSAYGGRKVFGRY